MEHENGLATPANTRGWTGDDRLWIPPIRSGQVANGAFVGNIWTICVMPEYHGAGIGKHLVEHGTKSRRQDCCRWDISTFTCRPTKRLVSQWRWDTIVGPYCWR